MRDALRNKCDLFADNYIKLKNKFKWDYVINSRLGALLYSMENRTVDLDAIERCRKVIKDNTGIFSQFKDTMKLIISIILSFQTEPEAILKGAVSIYNDMKKEGFHSSPYLVLASVSIALQAEPHQYKRIIGASRSFYQALKKEHKFITSSDDYGFAALLAMTDKSVPQAIREIENCFWLLKEEFSSSNAVQALSHVLAFSEEEPTTKCRRVVKLYQALKSRKYKLGKGIELSFLGVTALLLEDTDKLADEIAEATEYIKNKKGFGTWSISARERVMFGIALVCDDYLEDAKKNTMEMTLANQVTGILLAQQMATIAAASSAAAGAAAAAN